MDSALAHDMLAHDGMTVRALEQRRKDQERALDDLMHTLDPRYIAPVRLTRVSRERQ